tara:strand:+ start:603 stop:1979 length:1377 start_codon:yes stop_codon:yes gene_type:complete
MSYSDDQGSIPDLISLSKIPVNFEQNIETDLLEPVVFNQGSATQDGFCRFTLQNKGFLHSHSKLFISAQVNASVGGGYFNPATGVGQLVKKAVLKIGNKTLNEVSSWDSLHAVKSALIKNENNVEREQFTTGRFMNHQFRYSDGTRDTAGRYELDNGLEYADGDLNVPIQIEMNGANPEDSPTFSIDLSDLFPFLKVNQLPLYMISEPINIELTFYPTTNTRVQIDAIEPTGNEVLIRRTDLKFCADYVYYGMSDEMERFANANKDMSFSFVDYRLVETSVNATSLTNGIIRNLGMANRIVPRVLTLFSNTGKSEVNILSQANSIAPSVNASGVPGAVKYNIRYNDRFEFTSDIDNTARLFSVLTDAEGVPFLTRTEFANQKDTIATSSLQGRTQNTELRGHFFYLGTKLTGGRVGQRGLELHFSGGYAGTTADTMRNFCEYLRVARLSNGMFDIINA